MDNEELYKTITEQMKTWEDWKIDEYNNNFATSKYAKKLPYNRPNINKFEYFTDNELYILKRQAIESSCKIVMSGKYNEFEGKIHNQLLNEIIDEIKRRENNGC